jgi:hypothetical protein
MKTLRHEFVQYMPEQPEDGVIYISMKYRLAVHKCVCGCGNKVITPFSPTDWELRFYGESISLSPSIGNWNFDCQSHYWIVKNQIRFAGRWNFDTDDAAIKPVEVVVTQPVVKSGWKLKRLKSFFSFLS